MELAQLHSLRPQTIEGIAGDLRGLLPPGVLRPRASLGIAMRGPWRPADIWPGAIERLCWTVAVETDGPPLSPRGEERLGGHSAVRRLAPVHPIENIALLRGEGLVVVYSDAAR